MKKTQFKVEDIFGGVVSKDSISPEQKTKLNNFIVNININIKYNFFKPKTKVKLILYPLLLLFLNKISLV